MPKAASQRLHRLFEHRVEHRREVAGRGIDDLQHLGGRGLLLQRLARLGDQPRILHRDDRLRREAFEQRDLLVGERPHFVPVDVDDAEERALATQRDREPGANVAHFEPFARDGFVAERLGLAYVGNVDDPVAV